MKHAAVSNYCNSITTVDLYCVEKFYWPILELRETKKKKKIELSKSTELVPKRSVQKSTHTEMVRAKMVTPKRSHRKGVIPL